MRWRRPVRRFIWGLTLGAYAIVALGWALGLLFEHVMPEDK